MSKMRSDSNWNELTPEQREALEHWLFEENLGYANVVERAKKEWGLDSSVSSVGRYYRRRRAERTVESLDEAAESAEAIEATAAKADKLRSAALKVLAQRFLEEAMEGGDGKVLARLGRVLLHHEEREIQRERLALAREKFLAKLAKEKRAEPPPPLSPEEKARQEAEQIRMINWRMHGNRVLKVRPVEPETAKTI